MAAYYYNILVDGAIEVILIPGFLILQLALKVYP
jgi:hypothetical protein